MGTTYKLQPLLLKQEMENYENYDDTWEEKEIEWLPYDKNYATLTAFYYARFTMGMDESTNFGIKNILTLPSLANKNFNSLIDENDEPIFILPIPLWEYFFEIQNEEVDVMLLINIMDLNFRMK